MLCVAPGSALVELGDSMPNDLVIELLSWEVVDRNEWD
jgi:hypothetical protein